MPLILKVVVTILVVVLTVTLVLPSLRSAKELALTQAFGEYQLCSQTIIDCIGPCPFDLQAGCLEELMNRRSSIERRYWVVRLFGFILDHTDTMKVRSASLSELPQRLKEALHEVGVPKIVTTGPERTAPLGEVVTLPGLHDIGSDSERVGSVTVV